MSWIQSALELLFEHVVYTFYLTCVKGQKLEDQINLIIGYSDV